MDILTDQQLKIRAAERETLQQIRQVIEPLEPDPTEVEALRQAEADLEELFLLVVVGEFNAGKSAFINALLGEVVLPEGVTPTTATINLVRYAPKPASASIAISSPSAPTPPSSSATSAS